jgi:hypothetical protein
MKKSPMILLISLLGFAISCHGQDAKISNAPQLSLKSSSSSDVKNSMSECAGQWTYVVTLIGNGVLRFPDKEAALAVYSTEASNALKIAGSLPGGNAKETAVNFYNKLWNKHVEIANQHGKTQKAVELAVEMAMNGSKKCSNYAESAPVQQVLKGITSSR